MKSRKTSAGQSASKLERLRGELWPEVTTDKLWIRSQSDGFTTIPRTMSLLCGILDDLTPKGKSVAMTYLALWCRVWDEGVVEIKSPREMAFEAGFRGQRAENTWNQRMQELIKLGFIDVKAGSSGRFNYVLIWNPYHIVKRHKDAIQEESYTALTARAMEIGAKDHEDALPTEEPQGSRKKSRKGALFGAPF